MDAILHFNISLELFWRWKVIQIPEIVQRGDRCGSRYFIVDAGSAYSHYHFARFIFSPLIFGASDLASRRPYSIKQTQKQEKHKMNGIIYLVGLVVVVLAILSFLGLH